MAWLRAQERDVLETFLRQSDHCVLASEPDGTCLWANEAFLARMKYTESELTGYKNEATGHYVEGKKWTSFTVPDESLDADVQAVSELEHGKRSEYRCQKQYIPKNSAPEDVLIHVLRYPMQGDFKFCLVSVTFIDDAREMTMANMMETVSASLTNLAGLMSEMQERIANIETAHQANRRSDQEYQSALEKEHTDAEIALIRGKRALSAIPTKVWWALFWGGLGLILSLGGAEVIRTFLDAWEAANG